MQRSLRTRLTALFLALSILPLLFSAFLGIQQNISVQIQQAVSQQDEISSRVAIQAEEYIKSAENELRVLTEVRNIQSLPQKEIEITLTNLLSFSPVYDAISLSDSSGMEMVKVSRDELAGNIVLNNLRGTPVYDQPAANGETYFGPVTFDGKTGLPFMEISVPIIDLASGNLRGVLVAKLRFQAVWAFMSAAASDTRAVYMLDLGNRLVAHSNPSIALQGPSFVPPDEGRLTRGLDGKYAVLGRSPVQLNGQETFIVVSEVPWNVALATSIRFMQAALLIILLTVAVISLLSFRITRAFTRPIEELGQTATAIQGGNLNARVTVTSEDEIGLLGKTFNAMTEQLQEVLSGLEARVAERTKELEQSLAHNQKRAHQLETIAEVARAIATLRNVDELLANITTLVSERFGFYHSGIFMLDESGKTAVLRAANSPGGQRMLARKHALQVGQEGIVGYVAANKVARIALDVGQDAVFFNNPDLPTTRSEMALPLVIGGNVIGVLDIQSEEAGAFTEEDIDVLTTLANQVAIAIENSRLFAQSRQALDEMEKTFQQYVYNEWRTYSAQSNLRGYRAAAGTLSEIKQPLQKDGKSRPSGHILKVPVKLHNVVIGYMNINMEKPVDSYSQDELEIIQATVDRFALALENARLVQTSQRLAAKEQTIGEITSKISASINMRNVLQTAVEELGRTIPGAEVTIKLEADDNA